MGALPDPASPIPGTRHDHRLDPRSAPPLRAVPGPRPTAPDAEPTPPPAPPTPAPAPEPPAPEPAAPAPDAPQGAPEQDGDDHGQDQEVLEGPPWWAHLRPPDLWDTPAPTIREELARAWRGDHLPESGPWRYAETARTGVSALINVVLLALVHINRSAGRQAAALLFAAAVFLVLATR